MATRLLTSLAIALLALLVWRSVFSVNQDEVALRTRVGQIEGSDYGPGLHWQSPLDEVQKFDRRVLTRVYPNANFLTKDGQALNVDFDLQWRLGDARRFFQQAGGDPDVAAQKLADLVDTRIKTAVAAQTLATIGAESRAGLSEAALDELRDAGKLLGVELLAVQLQRIDLTDDEANVLYQRMQQSLSAQAQQLRSGATADADKIRADADRKRADLLADGTRQAQHIRAAADATAAEAYAKAYGRNPDFAAFYRSMQAYKNTLGREGDILVISPDGEFFKYLHSASGR